MLRGLLFLLALAGSAPALAVCPSRSADLQRPINEAQAAFASMDGGGFSRASGVADEALACLSEPISPASAASVHRHEALVAFVRDDPARARAAFRSALALQPSYRLPEDIAPAGNPLARLYEEARALGPGPDEAIWPSPGTTMLVDGATAASLPSDRPVIVQILSGDGAVLSTSYLRVGGALPEGLMTSPPDPRLAVVPIPVPPGSGVSDTPPPPKPAKPLLIGAAGAAAGAAGLYALSAVTQQRYKQEGAVPDASLDRLVSLNHGAVLSAAGVCAVGVGLGVVGVIRLSW